MKAKHEIELPLDERNLAHVLAALALAGLVSEEADEKGESRCWWCSDGFCVLSPLDGPALAQIACRFVRSMRWIPGLGAHKGEVAAEKYHGLLAAGGVTGLNPFASLSERDGTTSPLKTFASHQEPGCVAGESVADKHILENQQRRLPDVSTGLEDWLFQRGFGAVSWGFDSRVGSHAYDLGFGSNDEKSGNADPTYPAIELLSLAGASFFAAPHAWQVDEGTLEYTIWREEISLHLAPLAAAGGIEGLKCDHYAVATRGNAYGKGAFYRYFPEASLITKHNIL